MSDTTVADGPDVHPGRSARTLNINFIELVTFRFFWLFNDRRVRAWSRMVLSSPSDSPQCKRVICIVSVRGSPWCRGRSAGRARTVRAQVNFQEASPVQNNLWYFRQST
jgi:hypothetical protein